LLRIDRSWDSIGLGSDVTWPSDKISKFSVVPETIQRHIIPHLPSPTWLTPEVKGGKLGMGIGQAGLDKL
jgi:hypothetical protein